MEDYRAEITSIFGACRKGNYEDVQRLLTNHADFKSQLLTAKVLEDFKTEDTYEVITTTNDNSAKSLIDTAVLSGNSRLVQLLLNEGLYTCNDPHSPSMTPIHWLAKRAKCVGDDLGIITKMLVQAGYNINGVNHNGFTPLHLACLSSHRDLRLIKILVEEGADVNAQSKIGDTPFMISCVLAQLDVLEYLLQAGADMSINAEDILDIVMEFSSTVESPETLRCLLVYGFDLKLIDKEKLLRYLNWIPRHKRSSLIDLLLKLGYKFIDQNALLNNFDSLLLLQPPLSLQRICANVIRESLSPRLYTNLMKVDALPKCLKEDILMKEFIIMEIEDSKI